MEVVEDLSKMVDDKLENDTELRKEWHKVVRVAFNALTTDGFNLKYKKLTDKQKNQTLYAYYKLKEIGKKLNWNVDVRVISTACDFYYDSYKNLIKQLKKEKENGEW